MDYTISLTRDARLLAAFYTLREDTFRRELGIADFDGGEDRWDACSDTLLVLRDNQCIGGARVTLSTATQRRLLPLEEAGLDLAAHLPELALAEHGYAQVTRLAIATSERTPEQPSATDSALPHSPSTAELMLVPSWTMSAPRRVETE